VWSCAFKASIQPHGRHTDPQRVRIVGDKIRQRLGANDLSADGCSEQDILDAIADGTFKGYLLCKVNTPLHLRDRHSDLPLVIRKRTFTVEDLTNDMKELNDELNQMKSGIRDGNRKLISAYDTEDYQLFSTEHIQLFLEYGLEVFDIQKAFEFEMYPIFKGEVLRLIDERRTALVKGDKATSDQIKSILNSVYGATIRNPLFDRMICILDHYEQYTTMVLRNGNVDVRNVSGEHHGASGKDTLVDQLIADGVRLNSPEGLDLYNSLNSPTQYFEMSLKAKLTTHSEIVQIGFHTLAISKLLILRYHNFLIESLGDENLELIFCDTDSLYYCFSGETLEDSVPIANRAKFDVESLNYRYPPNSSKDTVLLGCFKPEATCHELIALRPKLYCLNDDKLHPTKRGCHGVQMSFENKRSVINRNGFYNALFPKHCYNILGDPMHVAPKIINRGMKFIRTEQGYPQRYPLVSEFDIEEDEQAIKFNNLTAGSFRHYSVTRVGLSAFYVKREVLVDGVQTRPWGYHLCDFCNNDNISCV
jgi:hypothetical protein